MSLNSTEIAGYLKKIFLHPIVISIFAAFLIIVAIIWFLSSWLGSYTEHGKEIELPDLKGFTVEEADNRLLRDGLSCIVIDSMYAATTRPGCVIDQVPSKGSKVKSGRKIYLYIRASKPRQVQLPEYSDKSLRQMQSELESAGLKVKEIKFVPSKYNTVIAVEYNGSTISAGKRLVEGSQVTLRVGKGNSNEFSEMPSLHGLPVYEAISRVETLALNSTVIFDVTPSSEDNKRFYKVYKQQPVAKAKLNGNETVKLYVTTTQSKLDAEEEVAED